MKLYKIVKARQAEEMARTGITPEIIAGTAMVCLSQNPTAIPAMTPSGFDSDDHLAVYLSTVASAVQGTQVADIEWWSRLTFDVPDEEVEEWAPWAESAFGRDLYLDFAEYMGGEDYTRALRFTRQPVMPSQIVSVEQLDDPVSWTDVTDRLRPGGMLSGSAH